VWLYSFLTTELEVVWGQHDALILFTPAKTQYLLAQVLNLCTGRMGK